MNGNPPLPAPRRASTLLPELGELTAAAAQLTRLATGRDDLEVAYEAAYGDPGDGNDPRGDDDLIRWTAKCGRALGVSAPLPYGAPPPVQLEAATDAVAVLLRRLGVR